MAIDKKEKVKKITTFIDNPEYAIFKQLDELNENIIDVKDFDLNKLDLIKGEPGDTPTDQELINLIKPLIPEAKDGKSPTKEELLILIRPLIPKVKDGEEPSDERLLSLIKPLIPQIKESIVDTPEQVAEKLNTLKEAVEASVIKGLTTTQDVIKELKKGQYLAPKNIKGMPLNFNDMRWHGGGITQENADDRYIIGDGIRKITVGLVAPTDPGVGDFWCDIS